MRWLAGAGLFALVGCNQIFGLSATQAFDAGPDAVLDRPHVKLDWQIGTVAAGAPAPTTFAPISPAPKVRLAAMTGDFTDAEYTAADGTIAIPAAYIHEPWRLEYTLADGIAHEVQWMPDDKAGHIAVPIFGRVNRDPVPTGSGYAITPMSPPASYHFPRVFTTGLWTSGIAQPPAGNTIDYDFSSAVSLSGPMGAPDAKQGDGALVIDYQVDGNTSCRFSDGFATLDPTLTKSAHTVEKPMWQTLTAQSITLNAIDVSRASQVGPLINDAIDTGSSFVFVGYVPSVNMPGLAGIGTQLQTLLPIPVMVELLQCPSKTVGPFSAVLPTPLSGLVLAEHVQVVGHRVVKGVTLVSGMEAVLNASTTGGATTVTFPAPLPLSITLTPPGATQSVALDGDTSIDQNPVAPSSSAFKLAFMPESGFSGDYYDVILHQISPSGLTTVRVYTILGLPAAAPPTERSVMIDGATLANNTDYVFEIRSYHGHPLAPTGDLTPISPLPYGEAIIFSRTISVKAP